MPKFFAFIALVFGCVFCTNAIAKTPCNENTTCSHGISIFGDLKYPAEFKHFEYINPLAPKGGDVALDEQGTFDSVNPFILKGIPAQGMLSTFDTLLEAAEDEEFSRYGLIAHTIELSNDRSYVIFHLRQEAKFHDGSPITAEDVVFSFNTLITKGHPNYRSYYADVSKAEALAADKVKFHFSNTSNRELPLIVGEFPIFSKKYYETHDFEKTTLDAPLSSGPYKVAGLDIGKWIKYERVSDYWAKDLPTSIGRYNFGSITYKYFRDTAVTVEAFKAGEYDFRLENVSKVWATAYDVESVRDGRIIKEEIPRNTPNGMQGLVFNMRRDKFQDIAVRKALNLAFDFEWSNKNLFYGIYSRSETYFTNSDFASSGLPTEAELALLEPFRDQLPAEVFTTPYSAPKTDGSGNNRENLKKAADLLKEAGYRLEKGALLDKTGKPFHIEFLLNSTSFERVLGQYFKNLKKLGISGSIRIVDAAQYIKRVEVFDFDVMVGIYPQSSSPGNEQISFWHSSKADEPGSRNLIGIKNPVVDALVEKLVSSPDKASLIAACRALDRVLLNQHYLIPNWHSRFYRALYWNKFGKPPVAPKYSIGFDSWWVKR